MQQCTDAGAEQQPQCIEGKQAMEMWKDLLDQARYFIKNKVYMAVLSLAAVCSYGFLVTHQTVGIDDTPYAYYFEEGLNAIVGRWFLYIVNKVFHVAEFSPFMTDLVGVLILMAAAVVWCSLLRMVCRDKAPFGAYLFFGGIFISCPLISEVYTYYLHNGVSVGYFCTGISLCLFREFMMLVDKRLMKQAAGNRKSLLATGLGSVVFLWVALGCYESFMIVWLLGVLLLLLTEKYMGVSRKIVPSLMLAAAAALAAVVLRSVMIALVIAVFDLGGMRDEAVQRSVTEMLAWIFQEGAGAKFVMVVKRLYVMYGVFACAYYPVRVFVWSAVFMTVFAVWRGIRQRSAWIPALTAGSLLVCFLLAVIEGKATYYRTAQFLPVVCAYGAFLLLYAVHCLKDGWRAAAVFALTAVLWNQCFDMNHWFYVDWMKYEAARNTADRIALELERSFDTSKPVVFTGQYAAPREIIGDAYVQYGTETFYRMKRWTDPIDQHLLEKFYRNYGVWVAQTPELSVIDWGRSAFGDDTELVRFFAMHGYGLTPYTKEEDYPAIENYSLGLPGFPKEGSIVDMGDYIIVHF